MDWDKNCKNRCFVFDISFLFYDMLNTDSYISTETTMSMSNIREIPDGHTLNIPGTYSTALGGVVEGKSLVVPGGFTVRAGGTLHIHEGGVLLVIKIDGVGLVVEAGGTLVNEGNIVEIDPLDQEQADLLYAQLEHDHDGDYAALEHDHDHGALTGLADDDHPQYHTDARGDARYVRGEWLAVTGEINTLRDYLIPGVMFLSLPCVVLLCLIEPNVKINGVITGGRGEFSATIQEGSYHVQISINRYGVISCKGLQSMSMFHPLAQIVTCTYNGNAYVGLYIYGTNQYVYAKRYIFDGYVINHALQGVGANAVTGITPLTYNAVFRVNEKEVAHAGNLATLIEDADVPHSYLANLTADDHPQYHNDVRGDARYSQIGHTHDTRYSQIGHLHYNERSWTNLGIDFNAAYFADTGSDVWAMIASGIVHMWVHVKGTFSTRSSWTHCMGGALLSPWTPYTPYNLPKITLASIAWRDFSMAIEIHPPNFLYLGFEKPTSNSITEHYFYISYPCSTMSMI